MSNGNLTNIRIVILILGAIALVSLGLVGVLALQEKPVPDYIIASGAGSISALGALLARPDSNEVVVTNRADDPVPVADSGQVQPAVLIALCVVAFLLGWLAHANGLFV